MAYTIRLENVGLSVALLWFITGSVAVAESAADHAAAIAPYLNDDTFIAACFDLTALSNTPKGDETAIFAAVPFLDDDVVAMLLALQGADQLGREIHAAGADNAYAIAGLADVNAQGGPVLLFPLRQGSSARDITAKLESLTALFGRMGWAVETRAADHAVLVGTAKTLDRYTSFAKSERGDLMGPLGKLSQDGAVLAAVFSPGRDFRRVVRELWPALPGPLAPLRGELADQWRHLEIGIRAASGSGPIIAIETTDEASAQLFAQLWRDIPATLTTLAGRDKIPDDVTAHVHALVEALPASPEGGRVSLRFPADEAQLEKLRELARDTADVSMRATRRKTRLKQFREIAIALLNHEGAIKLLPANAIRDKEGRPLLSWRVAILPFFGSAEAELHRQFRLDEPWDSPHNCTLIEKMPDVYADPDPKLSKLMAAGKTTYQVPVAPETVFHGNEGIAMRDITDGMSKTIVAVEVEPSRAVEWTKPDDWEVDVQNPLAGVKRDDRSVFTAAFADAHIEEISVNVDFKKLRGLLTRAGHEVFDWP